MVRCLHGGPVLAGGRPNIYESNGLEDRSFRGTCPYMTGLVAIVFDCCWSGVPAVTLAVDKPNVHIVLHTHNDLGWLKAVDEYYYVGKPFSFCNCHCMFCSSLHFLLLPFSSSSSAGLLFLFIVFLWHHSIFFTDLQLMKAQHRLECKTP